MQKKGSFDIECTCSHGDSPVATKNSIENMF